MEHHRGRVARGQSMPRLGSSTTSRPIDGNRYEAASAGSGQGSKIVSFKDRREAGRKLARALSAYRDQQPMILALPRGGVPVAAEVAITLKAPLDLVLVRKIGMPMKLELAMGAVVDGGKPIIVRNDDVIALAGVAESDFNEVCERELAEIERRRHRYLGKRPPATITGRTAIVIDDGVATGATTRAALRAIRARKPRRLVLAVPVAPTQIRLDCELTPMMSSASKLTSSLERLDSIIVISGRFPTKK